MPPILQVEIADFAAQVMIIDRCWSVNLCRFLLCVGLGLSKYGKVRRVSYSSPRHDNFQVLLDMFQAALDPDLQRTVSLDFVASEPAPGIIWLRL
jgi:hypothetical protein